MATGAEMTTDDQNFFVSWPMSGVLPLGGEALSKHAIVDGNSKAAEGRFCDYYI